MRALAKTGGYSNCCRALNDAFFPGGIPRELRSLLALQTLDLSGNDLTGEDYVGGAG